MNLVLETTNETGLHAVLNQDNEEDQHCKKRLSIITTQPADMMLSCSQHTV
jgi:hypothetical protein